MSRSNASRQPRRAAAQPAGWLPVARAATFLENERRRHPMADHLCAAGTEPRRSVTTAPTNPATLDSAGLAAGAAAVDRLLALIGGISDDGLAGSEGGDTRDYFEIAAAIGAFIEEQCADAVPERRQGVLLSLAVLLCQEGDSRFGANEISNPLAVVAQSLRDREACAVGTPRRLRVGDDPPRAGAAA